MPPSRFFPRSASRWSNFKKEGTEASAPPPLRTGVPALTGARVLPEVPSGPLFSVLGSHSQAQPMGDRTQPRPPRGRLSQGRARRPPRPSCQAVNSGLSGEAGPASAAGSRPEGGQRAARVLSTEAGRLG